MTREELKKHCEKQIQQCEFWARARGEEPGGKVYEEHKLILELLKQESFMNKPCISSGVCEHDKMEMLDNLKADIKQMDFDFGDFYDHTDTIIEMVLGVIDKYKEERGE